MSRTWEVERDRFGVTFSGPLEVGECIRVVPAEPTDEKVEAVMGVLDEIAADADEGRLGARNCQEDAERIIAIALQGQEEDDEQHVRDRVD